MVRASLVQKSLEIGNVLTGVGKFLNLLVVWRKMSAKSLLRLLDALHKLGLSFSKSGKPNAKAKQKINNGDSAAATKASPGSPMPMPITILIMETQQQWQSTNCSSSNQGNRGCCCQGLPPNLMECTSCPPSCLEDGKNEDVVGACPIMAWHGGAYLT
ncbi:Hypothetical predicted protein [Prunus dulcis]|uniref:Uncharacterized protein n=1 Tax=Prunus dulcis TaxID=3755 RepID=A0A5E4E7J5_PRUDU|nr:hypothetical protein L3X38_015154 [Prunus dulcis]VVA11382.1 Hypothetical predicted protein [Prunus dulcis]